MEDLHLKHRPNLKNLLKETNKILNMEPSKIQLKQKIADSDGQSVEFTN